MDRRFDSRAEVLGRRDQPLAEYSCQIRFTTARAVPYVEPHVHMDTCLTAGEPRWNESGTLWEGIVCWSERKATLTHDDVVTRVNEVLRWQVANGVLHVRSHVDTTDPSLVALDALIDVRERVRDVVNLQLVAFPQEGIVSFPDGEKLIAESARRGVDAIGAIPHFEDTREDGVRSLEIAISTALDAGLLIDVHCDEIDDEQSRFVEVLATRPCGPVCGAGLRRAIRRRWAATTPPTATSCSGSFPEPASTWCATRW